MANLDQPIENFVDCDPRTVAPVGRLADQRDERDELVAALRDIQSHTMQASRSGCGSSHNTAIRAIADRALDKIDGGAR